MLHPGSLLADRFEVVEKIGSGGVGTVYRARDRLGGAPVALKVLYGGGELEPQRFTREALVLAGLDHPSIVRYVAHGIAGSTPYLVMEWLDGETLADRLRRSPLSLEESLRLARAIAQALGVLHERGLVHRDVKPSNIMLVNGQVDRIKLLDFGLARAIRSTHAITTTGATLGTPAYMAPEQATSAGRSDQRADLYGLGAVIYATLAGRPPFQGGDAVATLLKLLLEEPPHLFEVSPDTPAEVSEYVMALLSKQPERRPQNVREVIAWVDAVSADLTEGPPSRVSITTEALTTTEKRLMCFVLLRLAPAVDPGATRSDRLLAQKTKMFYTVLEPFQGRIELVGEDLGIVVFSGEPDAKDLVRRAARCALALRAALPETQIVIVSGGGVLGPTATKGNLAERGIALLVQAERTADPSIWLDDASAGLLEAELELRRGKGAVELVGERALETGTRTLLGKALPCFGRERELATLLAFFEECASEPVARVVLLTAATGMGKSRLRYELVRILSASSTPPRLWQARAEAMSAGSAFAMVGQLVHGLAGVRAGEPLAARRAALVSLVSERITGNDAVRVSQFLGELSGTPFDAAPGSELFAARQSAQLMQDQLRRAWLDFVRAETARGPLLVVLEDLQWADLPTLELFDAALELLAEAPLMLLGLGRPELHEQFPGLFASRGVNEIRIGPLTRRASERLVRAALGDSVSDKTVTQLAERCEGNAFFLEELIRAVAERGSAELPETVLAMVRARLEALEPEARQALRAAAVFGQTFWVGGLKALLGGKRAPEQLSEWLDVLTQRELIQGRSASRIPSEREYVFRQSLVREAAYASLTDRDRELGHRLAGRWLESVGEVEPGALAEHYARGAEWSRAIEWYELAARGALQGNDLARAIHYADEGIAHCTAEDAARRGALLAAKSTAHQWRGENAEAEATGLEALAALGVGSVGWCQASSGVLAAAGRLAHFDRLTSLSDQLLHVQPTEEARRAHTFALTQAAVQSLNGGLTELSARIFSRFPDPSGVEQDDPSLAAAMHRVFGTAAARGGDYSTALARMTKTVSLLDAAGDVRNATMQRINVGYSELVLGAYPAAEQHLREALETAERLHLHNAVAMAKNNLGMVLARLGNLADGERIEREAAEAFTSFGDRRMSAASYCYLAQAFLEAGDAKTAAKEASIAVEGAVDLPQVLAFARALGAAADLALGRVQSAYEQAAEAWELMASAGIEDGEIFVRNTWVDALEAVGRTDEARQAARATRDRVLELASKLGDAELVRSFRERVPENARALSRGFT